MSAIRVHDARDNKWVAARDFAAQQFGMEMSAAELAKFPAEAINANVRMHEPGDDKTLQLFESILPADLFVDVHSHAADEIIYVVDGSLIVGNRTLGPGSSVFIKADTLYSFRSGPAGLQFLNFRPFKDSVYRTADEHRALMEERRAAKGEFAGGHEASK